jgi:hypothetical protein
VQVSDAGVCDMSRRVWGLYRWCLGHAFASWFALGPAAPPQVGVCRRVVVPGLVSCLAPLAFAPPLTHTHPTYPHTPLHTHTHPGLPKFRGLDIRTNPAYPNTAAWYAAMATRLAYQKVMQAPCVHLQRGAALTGVVFQRHESAACQQLASLEGGGGGTHLYTCSVMCPGCMCCDDTIELFMSVGSVYNHGSNQHAVSE